MSRSARRQVGRVNVQDLLKASGRCGVLVAYLIAYKRSNMLCVIAYKRYRVVACLSYIIDKQWWNLSIIGDHMDTQRLRLTQVERAVSRAMVPARPPSGWIRAIRSALGMTSRQLAARLGLSQSTVATLEKSEADDRITLHSLRKVADALDCDLQYVLVPRAPLAKRVEKQAEVIALDRVSRILHTMRLEDQAPTDQVDRAEVSRIQKKLLDTNWKQLWE